MSANWLTLGEILRVNAFKFPQNIALSDEERSFTYLECNSRVRRLANSLLDLGLKPGDKVAVLLENSIEICEIYWACAKAGLVIVPVNFRLVGPEVAFVVDNSDAKAFVVHDRFLPTVQNIRKELPQVQDLIVVGEASESATSYEGFLAAGADEEPPITVRPPDPWIQLYTSGTTGRPKGVVRSHESYIAFYLINAIDFSFDSEENCLTVMPFCHVNATFFSFNVTYVGGRNHVFPAMGFDAERLLQVINEHKITFISLVPTHYNLILNLPPETRQRYDLSSVRKLLCSSAPARSETKKGIMEVFPGVQLYEGYGSTEAGIVTTLYPDEQLTHLGSIGRESTGTDLVRILDPDTREPVPQGEIGELFSRGPMMFSHYYKLPERTEEAFAGEYFSAGDMAYQDKEGYFYLVDRKNNMIITGGENVFPSEIEEAISKHPAVFDVAVVGLSHPKWGEEVTAVVVLKEGQQATAEEIKEFCRNKMAGFKRPKKVLFIPDEDMPRTATGKILHRFLRERFNPSS